MSRNVDHYFIHNKEEYRVEWEEEDFILTLTFFRSNSNVELHKREVKLYGKIYQSELIQLLKDYSKSFVKNVLKDIGI